MTDMRASERLLEVIAEQTVEAVNIVDFSALNSEQAGRMALALDGIETAVAELRRRGDTLVRGEDLRLIAAAANHGRRYGLGGDTDYTGFEDALERIERALGGNTVS